MANKSKLPSVLLSLLLLSPIAQAENHLILIGGGGEPKGQSTIFDGDLKSLGDNNTFSDWKKTVIFNGGHATTEKIMKEKFKDANITANFDRTNYDKLIRETINKIKNGEIKRGDQMLINILTHGAEQQKGKEKSHRIALSGGALNNYETLDGTPTVSLDTLQELINVADQKGVKLGITNLSCFSGNLLKLNKKSACLIAQSIPESYSMSTMNDNNPNSFFYKRTGFAKNFFENMQKGKSLEDAFLAGRKNNRMLDYPIISTTTNDQVNRVLVDRYRDVADITDVFAGVFGKMLPDLPTAHDANLDDYKHTFQNYSCSEVKQLDAFLDSKNFDAVIQAMKTKFHDVDVRMFEIAANELNAHLKKISAKQMEFIAIMKEADMIWKRDFPESAKKFSKFSISSLLYGVEDIFILEISENQINNNTSASPEDKAYVLEIRQTAQQVINKLQPKQVATLRHYPDDMTRYRDEELSKLVKFQEKSTVIYDRIYNDLKTTANNNCANFIF